MNVGKISSLCDYFVILSAESTRRVDAIAEAIKEGFEKKGIKILHYEGKDTCIWVLLDIGDIIVHIFSSDMREFYALERLWSSAEAVKLDNDKN